RVRRPAGLIFAQKVGKDALAVLGCEADPVQHDAEVAGGGARILVVLRPGAVRILIVPVVHEQALDVEALIAQPQRGDGRIDPAGKTGNDTYAVGPLHKRPKLTLWPASPQALVSEPAQIDDRLEWPAPAAQIIVNPAQHQRRAQLRRALLQLLAAQPVYGNDRGIQGLSGRVV